MQSIKSAIKRAFSLSETLTDFPSSLPSVSLRTVAVKRWSRSDDKVDLMRSTRCFGQGSELERCDKSKGGAHKPIESPRLRRSSPLAPWRCDRVVECIPRIHEQDASRDCFETYSQQHNESLVSAHLDTTCLSSFASPSLGNIIPPFIESVTSSRVVSELPSITRSDSSRSTDSTILRSKCKNSYKSAQT
jgi:hypothetical protein